MAFPITYEARRNGNLEMLAIASEKGKYSVYYSNGVEVSQDDFPNNKDIYDDPKIGIGYMGIGNIMSEGIDQPKVTEGASTELVDSLVKEIKKTSK